MTTSTKKTIGSKKTSTVASTVAPVTTVETVTVPVVPVAPVTPPVNPVVNPATDNNKKENESEGSMNTAKRKGGLTKAMRNERAAKIREIRALLIGELANNEALKHDSAAFANAMLDLDNKVMKEYEKLYPKTAKKSGDPLNKPKKAAQFMVGRYMRKYGKKLTQEQIMEFLKFGMENPLIAKGRPDLKGKSRLPKPDDRKAA